REERVKDSLGLHGQFKKLSEANKSHRTCVNGPYAEGARNTQQQHSYILKIQDHLFKTFNDEHPKGMTEDDKRRLWAETRGEYEQGSLKKEVDRGGPPKVDGRGPS
ncbi:hypothetical protein V2J09_009499, partial [Rumex salicifolius]